MECEQLTELQSHIRKLERELREQNNRALTAVMELQVENKNLKEDNKQLQIENGSLTAALDKNMWPCKNVLVLKPRINN